MDTEALLAFRREKDDYFRTDAYSPLTPEQQAAFTGLAYYPPNADLDLVVLVEPFAQQDEVLFEMSSGDRQRYRRYGEFVFEVDGQTARLTLFSGPHGYFLPFADAGAGTETYGGGRYLEPEALGGNRFHVDFNLAYNPFCVYGPGWSCPLPPPENRLPVAIRAGEKLPEGGWVEVT